MSKKKIKVLQVIHGLHIGGAENVVKNIVKETDDNVFDVVVCCIKKIGVIGEQLIEEKYTVEKLLGTNDSIIRTIRSLGKLIEKYKPDVIHSHGTTAALTLGPLCMIRKKYPCIHTFHFGNYPHTRKLYFHAEKWLINYYDKLVTVSDSQKNAIVRYHKPRNIPIVTVYNGVHGNEYRGSNNIREQVRAEFGFSDSDIVVGCIVVLSKQKGVTFLIESISKIVKHNKNIKFLVAGGGPLEEKLESQAEPVKEFITFAGWRDDPHRLMVGLDIFILPSLWEGLPMVLLEAMASGLPIIATDVADNKKIIKNGESGLIIRPGNSADIESSILSLSKDMSKAKAMGERAYDTYEHEFTVKRMVDNYSDLYRQMYNQ
jgi:glycosyltransferase involved in cell wall biosynthesis